jgi:hypothetical protein
MIKTQQKSGHVNDGTIPDASSFVGTEQRAIAPPVGLTSKAADGNSTSFKQNGICEQFFNDFIKFDNIGRSAWYWSGDRLTKLQKARTSRGAFLKDLDRLTSEWDISRATCYRRIKFYDNVRNAVEDILLIRISQNAKVKFPIESIDEWEEQLERERADATQATSAGLLAEAVRRVEDAKRKAADRPPTKSVVLAGLTPKERDQLNKTIRQLTSRCGSAERASRVIFEGILELERRLKESEVRVA